MDGWFRMTFFQSINLPSPDVSSLLRDWIHWSQGCTLTQAQDIWDFEMKLNFQILLHLRFVSLCDMNCPSWLQARTWYKRIHDTRVTIEMDCTWRFWTALVTYQQVGLTVVVDDQADRFKQHLDKEYEVLKKNTQIIKLNSILTAFLALLCWIFLDLGGSWA